MISFCLHKFILYKSNCFFGNFFSSISFVIIGSVLVGKSTNFELNLKQYYSNLKYSRMFQDQYTNYHTHLIESAKKITVVIFQLYSPTIHHTILPSIFLFILRFFIYFFKVNKRISAYVNIILLNPYVLKYRG